MTSNGNLRIAEPLLGATPHSDKRKGTNTDKQQRRKHKAEAERKEREDRVEGHARGGNGVVDNSVELRSCTYITASKCAM